MNLNQFEDAIGWVRRHLSDYGYRVTNAVLDPYVEVWFFYEEDMLVLILGHADIERIAEGLYQRVVPQPVDLWKAGQGPTRGRHG